MNLWMCPVMFRTAASPERIPGYDFGEYFRQSAFRTAGSLWLIAESALLDADRDFVWRFVDVKEEV